MPDSAWEMEPGGQQLPEDFQRGADIRESVCGQWDDAKRSQAPVETARSEIGNRFNMSGKTKLLLATTDDSSLQARQKHVRKKPGRMQELAEAFGGITVSPPGDEVRELQPSYNGTQNNEMKAPREELCAAFGLSEGIVAGTYTNSEWANFVARVVEPIMSTIVQEMSDKLAITGEIRHSHRCIPKAGAENLYDRDKPL